MSTIAPSFPSVYDSGLSAIRNGQALIASSGQSLIDSFAGAGDALNPRDRDENLIGRALLSASTAQAAADSGEAQSIVDFFRGKAQVEAGVAIIAAADHNARIVIDLLDPKRHRDGECDCER